jgi:lycopene cyclase domain-containing protein
VTYTAAVVVGVAFAFVLDLLVLRTNLLRRKAFWTSYVIVLLFQLVVNGVLTGQRLVVYSSRDILGARLFYAPIEDLGFGFSLVLQTLAWWVWWGRRAAPARASHARLKPATASPARRPAPTETRRSRTR